jgi:hypothetical protein
MCDVTISLYSWNAVRIAGRPGLFLVQINIQYCLTDMTQERVTNVVNILVFVRLLSCD